MSVYPKILFPVDYSSGCIATIPYVKEMVKRMEAELILLHVVPLYPLPEVTGDFMGTVPLLPVPDDQRATEREALDKFANKYFPDTPAARVLYDGEAAQGVAAAAKQLGVSLIMLPTHGAGVIRRLLLGSVTAKVLHDADCAVWTGVPSHFTAEKAQACCTTVVCALSGEAEHQEKVAARAAEVAKTFNARLVLTHVVEPPQVTWDFDFTPYREKLMGEAEQALLNLVAKLGIEAGVRVECDMIPRGVQKVCLEERADLLVLGRGHARQAIGRLWSQLYETIREAPCPVISTRFE
jgi:nucleotide-binding universal stress UspA family protein